MRRSSSKPTPSDGFRRDVDWELRPGGMIVQRRNVGSESDPSSDHMIRVKVSLGSYHHPITIHAHSTFGDLKRVLRQQTGLEPAEQRLLFRGKEKEDEECLHMAGVNDMSKVMLLEDPASQERKLEEMKRNTPSVGGEAVGAIRAEVDKLAEKVAAVEGGVNGGKKRVEEKQVNVLTELLMIQLLKLDAMETVDGGDAKLQRRTQVRIFPIGEMESHRMRMIGQGGLPPVMASLPPLPPSRLGRSSNQQYSTPPSSLSQGRPMPSGERLLLLRPHWSANQTSDLNLNLHGNGKSIVTEEAAPPPLPLGEDPTEIELQIPQCSDKDLTAEAKRLRRVMQSRQYSQKYRMKQLHYISQLESELKALQAEVTITSPRIKFMDRQNSLLRAENYTMKEKLSAYTGELMFKEAQYEELKRERNMLKEIHENYQLKLLETKLKNNAAGSSYQLANMVAIGQHDDLNQKPADPAALHQLEIARKSNPFSMLEN